VNQEFDSAQFEELLLGPTQWIDVRAPVEFCEGAVPGAVNLPLLSDDERHQVGITYKQQGRESAIELGQRLVSGTVKQARLEAWLASARPATSVIYCFRGGLRSRTVQTWLAEQGVERPLIVGGYKALRRFLLEVLAERIAGLEFLMVHGSTGSGKTRFLLDSGRPYIDLEGLAAHRGSAFGAMPWPQPAQADFENRLALQLLRLMNCREPILLEAESRAIGKCFIPEALLARMQTSPRLQVELPLEARVENILNDYVVQPLASEDSRAKYAEFRRAVQAISRKLGGVRAQEILADLNFSEAEFVVGRGLESNRVWIRKLLQWYYDPRYLHASERMSAV
jgi:tRNA 2-selenouridine synthase